MVYLYSVKNVTALAKLIGLLLFSLSRPPPPFYFVFENANLLMYIKKYKE